MLRWEGFDQYPPYLDVSNDTSYYWYLICIYDQLTISCDPNSLVSDALESPHGSCFLALPFFADRKVTAFTHLTTGTIIRLYLSSEYPLLTLHQNCHSFGGIFRMMYTLQLSGLASTPHGEGCNSVVITPNCIDSEIIHNCYLEHVYM